MNYLLTEINRGYILRSYGISYHSTQAVMDKLLGKTTNVVKCAVSNEIFFKMKCKRYIK